MNDRIEELADDCWVDAEGEVYQKIDYEKFAKLIVRDCLIEIERLGTRSGPTEHNKALALAWSAIADKFGVTET